MPLRIEEIDIPKDRFGDGRTEEGKELADLGASIAEFGILEPIIIDEENRLIAGERRLIAAVKYAGRLELEDTEYKYLPDLSETDKRRIELEENILRLDLTWAEEAKALAEIDRLRKSEDPEWNTERTAELVGRSRKSAYDLIRVANEMEKDPTLEDKGTLYGALKEIQKKKELDKRRKIVEHKQKGLGGPDLRATIIQGDALDLISKVNDESIDAVITNPPFGVNLELGHEKLQVYEDDEDYVTDLVADMVPHFYRILKPNTWAVIFWDIKKLTYNKYMHQVYKSNPHSKSAWRMMGLKFWLEQAGFQYVSAIPCSWIKPNKTTGLMGDPSKTHVSAYECFVFAAKSDAKLLKQGRQNIFIYETPPTSERVHPLQMPTTLTKDLAESVCLGGETILDPFAGSGSIGLGALEHQCEFIGFELDPEKAKNGNMLLQEHAFSSPNE